jgi:hypothetical protein
MVGGYEGDKPNHRCPQIPRFLSSSQFKARLHNSHTNHVVNGKTDGSEIANGRGA